MIIFSQIPKSIKKKIIKELKESPQEMPERYYKELVEMCSFPLISIDDIISLYEEVESGELMNNLINKGKKHAKSKCNHTNIR